MKLPLCHGRRLLPCLLFFRLIHFAAYADRRIRWNGNDRNLERLPACCDVARAGILSVAADFSAFYEFPKLNAVPYGNALKGSALNFSVNDIRGFVAVKFDDCLPSVAFNPGAFNLAQNFVAMMVIKQYADFIQAGKVYRSGPVV